MQVQTWLFGVPFALGVLLVMCSALGAAELDDMVGGDGEGLAGDQGLLAWLGLGRVPAIIVVTFLLLIFGGVGLLLCTPLSAALGGAAGFFATVPVASASAFLGTSFGARGLARILPRTESYAPDADELLGRTGRVSVCLDATSCIVRVTDAAGAEHRLQCRMASDDVSPTIAVGDSVLLIGRGARVYVARKVS
jgi:hypothetical protein